MTAPKTIAFRSMSTEAVGNIDQVKDLAVTPNNSAGEMELFSCIQGLNC
jgi:hypothetical protein